MTGTNKNHTDAVFKCSSCEFVLKLKKPYQCVRCVNAGKSYRLIPWYIKRALTNKEVA